MGPRQSGVSRYKMEMRIADVRSKMPASPSDIIINAFVFVRSSTGEKELKRNSRYDGGKS